MIRGSCLCRRVKLEIHGKLGGSTLQFISAKNPGIIDVALGVPDDDPGIRVPCHIFVASRAPWFEINDGLPQYPERSVP